MKCRGLLQFRLTWARSDCELFPQLVMCCCSFFQFFAIFAFSTCGSYSGMFKIAVECKSWVQSDLSIEVEFEYPFRSEQKTLWTLKLTLTYLKFFQIVFRGCSTILVHLNDIGQPSWVFFVSLVVLQSFEVFWAHSEHQSSEVIICVLVIVYHFGERSPSLTGKL